MRAETVTMTASRRTQAARRSAPAAVVARRLAVGGVGGVAGAGRAGEQPPARRPTAARSPYVVACRPGQPRPAHVGVRGDHLTSTASPTRRSSISTRTARSLPGLAESWEETPTSVTYTLKDGITCADGTPLTASTVADNFSFVADPANQSPLLGLYVPPGITAEADDAARTVTLDE